jgi:hypothetical protein
MEIEISDGEVQVHDHDHDTELHQAFNSTSFDEEETDEDDKLFVRTMCNNE